MTGLQKIAQLSKLLDAAPGAIDNASDTAGWVGMGAPTAASVAGKVSPRLATGVSAVGAAANKTFIPLTAASMVADGLRGVADPQGARDRLDAVTQDTASFRGGLGSSLHGLFNPFSTFGATLNETGGLLKARMDQGAAERGSQWTREQLAKPGLPKRYAKTLSDMHMRRSTMDDAISPFNPLRITEDRLGQAPGSMMQSPATPEATLGLALPEQVTPGPESAPTGLMDTAGAWLQQNPGKAVAGAGGLALLTYLLARRKKRKSRLADYGY